METHKLGCFYISKDFLIGSKQHMLKELMSHLIVLRAEFRLDINKIEYIAYSDLFDSIPKGEKAPIYEINITTDPEDPDIISKIEAVRVKTS